MTEVGDPSEDELSRVSQWDFKDPLGWMAFIHSIWKYADAGYFDDIGSIYYISTAGWSGNERIIQAMKKSVLWQVHWLSSRRGGHYCFEFKGFVNEGAVTIASNLRGS